jgi:hypothetical protein
MAKRSRASSLSPDVLRAALSGLEAQLERVDGQIGEVQRMLGRGAGRFVRRAAPILRRVAKVAAASPAPLIASRPRKRGPLSAAARRRIAAAQKKRWADFRKLQKP